ncbi:hypothetical protein NE237_004347 [Protea cynaroides]|uniref:Wound-induced protein 1 n=1 Tax=Protea cynaroides TaxID=273540 RepID=A0A9Q0QTG2_9MAGN|nr:hypothetical protein NE237_004347 [Protea cynaroides]
MTHFMWRWVGLGWVGGSSLASLPVPELANSGEILEERSESSSIGIVKALYEALSTRDVEAVHRLLAPDIEWWFHGPPSHQHMMRLLTGTSSDKPFVFLPLSFTAIGTTVLVEGTDKNRSVSWIHAWTVNTDGIITQVREYFNTSLTVTRIFENSNQSSSASPSSSSSSSSSSPVSLVSSFKCQQLWQSKLSYAIGKDVPGLVLAI